MREIVFRAKRTYNGEWVEGYYIHIPEGEGTYDEERHLIQQIHNNGIIGFSVDVIPETVGQYTGLTDKNGKKIFEGDIVVCELFEETGQIAYHESEAMFVVEFDTWLTDFDHLYGKDLEVIGNIHDNPELLKGGAE